MHGELLGRIVSLLFPYKCIYCGDIAQYKEVVCDDCLETLEQAEIGILLQRFSCGTPCFLAAVSAFEYADKVARAVAQLKFSDRRDSAPHLASLMAQAWRRHMSGVHIDCVVPVPMHPSRLKKRGYNQSRLLADEAASLLGAPCHPDMLVKIRDNDLQHELSANERLINIRDVFAVSDDTYQGKSILLIDDVLTTGATVNECARKLIEAGAGKVYALTLAATL